MTCKFLGCEYDPRTASYGQYPEEMRIEVLAACDVPYSSGISALSKLWAWKERLNPQREPPQEGE